MSVRSQLLSFLNELKRRNVLRVGAAYIVAAWLVIQVAETIFPLFGYGDMPARLVVIVLSIGFIPSLIFSWVFEITPEGLKKDADVDHDHSITQVTGKKLDRVILVVLALALAYFAFDKFVLDPARDQSKVETARQEGRAEALVKSYGDNSIAVLPFVNMSSDMEQEYFSDGISEELLNLLAKIPELRVISRSSAFAFKGKEIDIPVVAEKLNVAHILEGSVRKAGNHVRITAQLIEARSDTHLWSETYDRQLDDIFAIQDEIAARVVAQLKVTLLGDIPQSRPVDTEAYALYLHARQLMRNIPLGELEKLEQAIDCLKLAVGIDANFSDAYVGLVDAYFKLSNSYFHRHMPSDRQKAEEMAKAASITALELAPQSSEAMRALGMIATDPLEKEKAFRQVIDANPNNVDAYRELASLLLDQGLLEEGSEMMYKAHQLDPLNGEISDWLGMVFVMEGRLKEASVYFRLSSEQAAGESFERSEPSAADLEYLANLPATPNNLNFEENIEYWMLQQECADNYKFSSSDESYSGQRSGHLVSLPESVGWCNTGQSISAKTYLDKYIRLVGMVRTRDISDFAKLWIRIDAINGVLGFADGWPNYIKDDSDWTKYELRLYVPSDATEIHFGGLLDGKGEMWMDDMRLEVFDNPDFQ